VRAESLLVLVFLLAAFAAGALAFGGGHPEPGARPIPMQRAVGGFGAGPAVHPARCARAYDGRVTPFCSWRHGAVAGGDRYCPLHGAAPR